MSVIPEPMRKRFRAHAKNRAQTIIADFCELRDFIKECPDIPLMTIYLDAATDLRMSDRQVRWYIATIREYSEAQLTKWAEKGIAFETIHIGNAAVDDKIVNKDPADLISEAYEIGNASGDTMSADEFFAHVMGGQKGKEAVYFVNRAALRLVESATKRLGWNTEKRNEFDKALREFLKTWIPV